MSAPRLRDVAAVGLQLPLALTNVYLLGLLGAAAAGRRGRSTTAVVGAPAVVLVPAHDEEDGVAATVASLRPGDPDREVVVIADNCGDRTAAVARAAGATVIERADAHHRGKGHALAWALEWLAAERPATDMVVMVDADCLASPNLVGALRDALADGGAAAAQARYEVANADASPAAGLRSAAFALWNTVRPLGKERLGLSCGLLGTGMAFRRDVLDRVPWEAFGVAED
ncbi:MAG TPA: glycosyltransferase family 2 protein, partial [Baekduia sp.]|nr:glycosyltransferase family 2 protein [Baekduia sp.]